MQDLGIDRPARDALAALIVNHLNGSIRTFDAHQTACENPLLLETADPDILALANAVAAVCGDLAEDPATIGPETRAWLARVVVFLHSDRALKQVYRSDYHPRQIVGAVGVLMVVLGAVAAFFWESWVPFAVCWAAAGTLTFFYHRLHADRPPAEVEALGRWAPFASQANLLAYAHLLGNDKDLLRLALGDPEESRQTDAVPRVRLSWFLFGPLYGTLYLPRMLRSEQTAFLLVDEHYPKCSPRSSM